MNQHKFTRIDSKLEIPLPTPQDHTQPPEALRKLIQRYLNGETTAALAQENQVNRKTIYNWMLAGVGDEHYSEVVTQCLVNRIAEADQELDDASNALHIARAREKARFSRMDFERRRPELYGQKQEVTHKGNAPVLSITIVDNSGASVDGTVVHEHTSVMSNTPELPKK